VPATDGSTIDLDQRYASERAQILTQPGDAQDGLMQAKARSSGEGCDQGLDQQAAAQARAQQEAAQRAQAEAQAQAQASAQAPADAGLLQTMKAHCTSIGGVRLEQSAFGGTCWPDPNKVTTADGWRPAGESCGDAPDQVSLMRDGSIDSASLDDARRNYPGCWR
jgi:hypothetical protein